MNVVYAMASGHMGGPNGLMVFVRKGTHWPAADPAVVANPEMFSPDPRWGLCTTVPVQDSDEAPADPAPAGSARRRAGAA
jgi:hypothetical protein